MAVTLNLLPTGYAVSGPLGKVLKLVRMLNVILLSGFIIFVMGLGAYFVFISAQSKNISLENDGLKSQIAAQAKTEQTIFLLKDRITKINSVHETPSSVKVFTKIEPFLASIGQNSDLIELSIDPQKFDMSVVFRTNSDLTEFLSKISNSDVFKSVTLTTFGYNPASGYLATFHIL